MIESFQHSANASMLCVFCCFLTKLYYYNVVHCDHCSVSCIYCLQYLLHRNQNCNLSMFNVLLLHCIVFFCIKYYYGWSVVTMSMIAERCIVFVGIAFFERVPSLLYFVRHERCYLLVCTEHCGPVSMWNSDNNVYSIVARW